MNTQPEALRLADMLEVSNNGHPSRVAEELRRLHEVELQKKELLLLLRQSWHLIVEERDSHMASYGRNFREHRAESAGVLYKKVKSVLVKEGFAL